MRRHFAWLAGRQVHYLRAGTGPAVLLLHQCPASSAELIPLIRQLASEWTVIAPDTPGNGLSEPLLLEQAVMSDYARAVVDLMDCLGIGRAAVYGFHGGGACALAIADLFPQRVTTAIVNGYSRMSDEETADILAHYFMPLPIDWSGSHLAWIWARVREQFIFFPWYQAEAESRLATGIPRVEVLQAMAMDLLRAGEHYINPYRAAFIYDRDAVLRALQVPTLLMTARNDALYRYVARMPAPSSCVRVEQPRDYAGARALLVAALRTHASSGDVPPPAARQSAPPLQLCRDVLQLPSGSLLTWRASAADTAHGRRAVLFCHDSAGSADAMRPYMMPLIGTRALLACDLPGNGESHSWQDSMDLHCQVDLLATAAGALSADGVDLVAEGDAVVLAVEMALRHPRLVKSIAVVNLAPFRLLRSLSDFDPESVSLPLQRYGEHLLTAWHRARDERLFPHWQLTDRGPREGPQPGELELALIQQRALDLLKCRATLPQILRQRLGYLLDERLASVSQPVHTGAARRSFAGAADFMQNAAAFFDRD